MRNLYNQLKISSQASHDRIVKAIDREIRSYLKEEAKFVLLNKDRKRVYDRCNDSLIKIGKLRANLGLNHAPNWVGHNFTDYHYSPTRNVSIIEEIINPKTESQNKTAQNKEGPTHNFSSDKPPYFQDPVTWFFILFGGIILLIAFMSISNENSQNFSVSEPTSKTDNFATEKFIDDVISDSDGLTSDEPAFNKEPVPLPVNGYTYNYTSSEELAPFQIKVPWNSDHYFVKMENYYSGSLEYIIFIRAGQSVEIEVPLGTYRVKYATGEDWYGMADLFGPGIMTSRFVADEIFRFENKGTYYSGYTVELIEQVGGNLDTRRVSASEW